ncbi:restriction endonuclease subunit S [Lactobacillus sp. 23-2]|uniref:restriction endonuclease subunit S n=1 Tax=Lactobacillus sp. 23-2 TaxID=2981842 RepID=UPI0038349424
MVSELPLTISAQDGLISQDEFFNKKVASKDLSSYLLLHHGDFAYNKSYSNGYPFGTIKRLEKYPQGVVSSLYIAFKPNSRISSDFMAQYYESNNWHKEIYKCAAEGARNHGLLNVPPSDFFATDLNIPIKKSEQLKIGRLLNVVDHTITLHEEKKRQLERLKSALLQKMFADKSGYPAVRFVGFENAWEQCKLGNVATFSKGTGYSKSDLIETGSPIILYGRLYTKYETKIRNVDTFVVPKAGSVVSKGGEVIVPGSGETAEDISIASVVEPAGILLGGDLNIIYPNTDLDPTFLAITISNGRPHFDMARRAQGKSIVHLHNADLKQILLKTPNLSEQKQICRIFESLDRTITLHDQKLRLLKYAKQSLLQKMFI